MRAEVLSRMGSASWEAGMIDKSFRPRSVAELKEAAEHFERAGALSYAPALKAHRADYAAICRTTAAARQKPRSCTSASAE